MLQYGQTNVLDFEYKLGLKIKQNLIFSVLVTYENTKTFKRKLKYHQKFLSLV